VQDDNPGRSRGRNAAGAGESHDSGETATHDEPLALTDERPGRQMGQGVKKAGQALSAGFDAISDDAGGIATAVAVGVGAALLEAELIPGILVGAGAVLLGKMFPQVRNAMRPMVKSAVGAGLALADKAREMMAEANEQMQDVVAEVRSERDQQRSARPGSTARSGGTDAAEHEPQAQHDEKSAHGSDAADAQVH
jgi:hypothetical protein